MRSAQNFMRVAERFGNSNTSWKFNSSQMWEMLALPAEETEKFIAEQTANDNPVEDMSVRELKTKVAQYIVELKVGLLQSKPMKFLFRNIKQTTNNLCDDGFMEIIDKFGN